MTTHKFEAEVSELLHLIVHSLYSNKEIFLRELISNASDALDKLRYLTLTQEQYKGVLFDPRIDLSFNADKKQLEIKDSGIGMDEKELMDQIGTIARSGTKRFLEQLSGDQKRDSNLIGQFGVGFYSSFMAADQVEVISRKVGTDQAYHWESNGKGEYEITPAERESHGTTVILHLNEEGKEFASRWRMESVIKKYSNHIAFPIHLHYDEMRFEGEGKDRKEVADHKCDQINAATALWKRAKKDVQESEYGEFFRTVFHEEGDPLMVIHTHAEGGLEYSTLFFVPKKAPLDMYHPNYLPGVKLYVNRVFITDDDRELMPTYLRFVRGIIDSEDLPLNVSREILQHNRILEKIRSASVKKLLDELQKYSEDKEKYSEFYKEFGRALKEGLAQDFEHREKLLELVRFKSTKQEGWTSLKDYKGRMKGDQKAIYYVTGEKEDSLRISPLLEAYTGKDIEVLIMDNEIDEIAIPTVGRYDGMEFRSINRTDAAEDLKSPDDKKTEKQAAPIIKRIKKILKGEVKDVKASTRLSDSPSCIVVDTNDPTLQMQGILKTLGQKDLPQFKPILEINPKHEIVEKLETLDNPELFEDICRLLLEQALLVEGVELKNPVLFVNRLNRVMRLAL